MSKKFATDEERRAYYAERKRAQRARAKQEEQATQAEQSIDPNTKNFLERFNNLSPEDRRDWLRVNPRFLQIQCEGLTRGCVARGMQEKLVHDLAAKYGCAVEEVVREKVKMDLAAHYGFSEEEVEALT